MPGFSFWNAAIRSLSCAWASLLVPGRSPATVIVIVFFLVDDSPAAATESARHTIASRESTARVWRLFMETCPSFRPEAARWAVAGRSARTVTGVVDSALIAHRCNAFETLHRCPQKVH